MYFCSRGARHGHRCKGKLARVAEQEALMLAAMNQTEVQEKKEPEVEEKKKKSSKGENKTDSSKENEEESVKSEKSKKKKKDKSNLSEDAVQPAVDVTETNVCSDVQEKKKKKKRKHEECDTIFHVSEEQNDAKEKTMKFSDCPTENDENSWSFNRIMKILDVFTITQFSTEK